VPFIQEILECKKTEIHKDNLGMRMLCPVPTKVRLKWVETLEDEGDVLYRNWQMVRPNYCCIQPDMLD
jgi:hypothetical protein